jgi:hypothetical protein
MTEHCSKILRMTKQNPKMVEQMTDKNHKMLEKIIK